MTESDLTLLVPGTKERIASLVGRSVDGAGPVGGLGVGAGPRIAFACAEFNGGISDRLLTGALDALKNASCDLGKVTVAWAPGAFELPLVAKVFAESGAVDAVVCLGAVIRGDTGHYDFVAGQCAAGHPAGPARHRHPGGVRRPHHRHGGPGAGPLGGRRGEQGPGGGADRDGDDPAARGARSGHAPGSGGLTMLRMVLPKGSLEKATLELFASADLAVTRSSDVDYRATIDDPRVDEVRILRPQEIPLYVADGMFDLGITGRDWVEERGSEVTTLGILQYSKASSHPVRVVLAVPKESPVASVADLAASGTGKGGALRVSTEYPELTRRFLEKHGVRAEVSLSYGATEAKVPDIADCVVEITETGRALRAAGLKIVETLFVSHTELIANRAAAEDPDKRHAMEQLFTLLQGALGGQGQGPGEAQRRRRPADLGHRPAPVPAVSDRLGTVRQGRVRGGDGGAEVGDQHPDPGPEGPGCHRHHRAGPVQDRPLR